VPEKESISNKLYRWAQLRGVKDDHQTLKHQREDFTSKRRPGIDRAPGWVEAILLKEVLRQESTG